MSTAVVERDQREISRHWAATHETRAEEYRRLAEYHREAWERYEAEALRQDAIARAERTVANG